MKTTRCPYCPTCSNYGLIAVGRYGAVCGGTLALWRILRCNPFSHGGYDPVPDAIGFGPFRSKGRSFEASSFDN